jgi:hypothetical protein
VISARVAHDGDFLLVAPVRGLTSEAERLLREIEGFTPSVLGVGLSPEELRGLTEYFVVADAEPVVPLTSNEGAEVRGLARFGEVRVPNPSLVEALRWAAARAVPVEPLDPGDDRAASLFAEHIGYVELVRRTVRERRVARNPPAPSTPDEFALAWDREIAPGAGSRSLAAARNRYLVRQARRLAAGGTRVAVVVDRERFEGVKGLLEGPLPVAMEEE